MDPGLGLLSRFASPQGYLVVCEESPLTDFQAI